MKFDFRSRGVRIFVGIAIPLLLLVGALFLYFVQSGPPCVLHKLTGIYCPGCGVGRMCVSLLHGDILAALDYNLLFALLLPFLLYYLLKLYIAYVFGKDALPFFKLNKWGAIALLSVILLFTVLRNIPLFPFSYLAP